MARKKKSQARQKKTQKPREQKAENISAKPIVNFDQADRDILPRDDNADTIEVVLENVNPDDFKKDLSEFTDDEDILDDFADRQQLNTGGALLFEKLNEHTMNTPEDSAGDLDAAWEDAEVAGEETLGGSTPTPDQDLVDELGEAAGLSYGLEEPLNADKINDRDRNRWELNPASADDTEDQPSNEDIEVIRNREDEVDTGEEDESAP